MIYGTKIDMKEQAIFILQAKKNGKSCNDANQKQKASGLEEYRYEKGDWKYLEIRSGVYIGCGQEIIWYKGKPEWAMVYHSYIIPLVPKNSKGNLANSKIITIRLLPGYNFIAKCLIEMDFSQCSNFKPHGLFDDPLYDDFKYRDHHKGDITLFSGIERIYYKNCESYRQQYMGGLIIKK